MLPRYENKVKEIQGMVSKLLLTIIEGSRKSLEAYEKCNFETCNVELFDEVKSIMKSVENDANTIDNEVIKTFALFGPEANELRTLVAYLKMTNELVRIADGVKKYARRMKSHTESDCDLKPLNNTIIQLHKSSLNALQFIYECFTAIETCDIDEVYRKIMVEESKNDDLFGILEKEIMTQIMHGDELSIEYVRVLGSLRKLERSCDRSVNIANLMLFAQKGGDIHIYN